MTNLIEPGDPRYFVESSIESYDRHDYKVIKKNGDAILFGNYEDAKVFWWNTPPEFLSCVEVLDKKKKSKGF